MNKNAEELREELRQHFSSIAATFDRANTMIFEEWHFLEDELREHLQRIDAEQIRARAITMLASLKKHLAEQRTESAEQLATWKATRQTSHLHVRADRRTKCAVIATELAMLAMDQAEWAIIQALLSREEAMAVQITHIDAKR